MCPFIFNRVGEAGEVSKVLVIKSYSFSTLSICGQVIWFAPVYMHWEGGPPSE